MHSKPHVLVSLVLALPLMLASCAMRGAPDFTGRWQAVNRYAEQTEAIPLRQVHVFRSSPMDGTLRNLLARWARDAGIELDYRHPSDFTLHAPVAQVHAQELSQAAAQVASIYAAQRVAVTIGNGRIVVDVADGLAAGGDTR